MNETDNAGNKQIVRERVKTDPGNIKKEKALPGMKNRDGVLLLPGDLEKTAAALRQ